MPFPVAYTTDRRGKMLNIGTTTEARHILRENPDAKGLLTPPMEEEFKKSEVVDRAAAPWLGHESWSWENAVGHGVANYLLRLVALIPRGEASSEEAKKILKYSHIYARPVYTEKKTWNAKVVDDIHKLDPKKAYEEFERYFGRNEIIPPQDMELIKRMFPDIIEAGKIMQDVTKRYMQKYKKYDALEAFTEILKHPAPHSLLRDPNIITDEELLKLHKLHVKMYNAFPGAFKEKSGVERLLRMRGVPKEKIEEIEREAEAELYGEKPVWEEKIVGEHMGVPLEEGDVVEEYDNTGIKVIRKKDGRIIVPPPHKRVDEIPDLVGPDPIEGFAGNATVLVTERIKNIDNIKELAEKMAQLSRHLLATVENATAGKPPEDVGRYLEQLAKQDEDIHELLGEDPAVLKAAKRIAKSYSSDHVASEYAAGVVAALEAKRILEDMYKNPKKYGLKPAQSLSEEDAEQIAEILEKQLLKVHGFHHKKKL